MALMLYRPPKQTTLERELYLERVLGQKCLSGLIANENMTDGVESWHQVLKDTVNEETT
jgi:hypothetical protein